VDDLPVPREECLPDQLTEVLVGGHQDGAPYVCVLQNFLIGDAEREFGHVDDVMAVPS
jgi:hypothetical protein